MRWTTEAPTCSIFPLGVFDLYSVYMHTCPNGKKYIGMTGCENIQDRWRYGHGYKHDTDFQNAIFEFGWRNISHEIIATELCKKDAEELERALISQFMTTDPEYGYNSHSGGIRGAKINKATRERMSIAQSGEGNPLYGKHHSAETKEKIGASKRGKPLSSECKRKLSAILSGKNNPAARQVAQYTKDMQLVKVWPYIRAAEAATGARNISTCCLGKLKTSGGYIWRYWEVGGA